MSVAQYVQIPPTSVPAALRSMVADVVSLWTPKLRLGFEPTIHWAADSDRGEPVYVGKPCNGWVGGEGWTGVQIFLVRGHADAQTVLHELRHLWQTQQADRRRYAGPAGERDASAFAAQHYPRTRSHDAYDALHRWIRTSTTPRTKRTPTMTRSTGRSAAQLHAELNRRAAALGLPPTDEQLAAGRRDIALRRAPPGVRRAMRAAEEGRIQFAAARFSGPVSLADL